jgi:uncharacterized protein YjbI with pentapeptide repeats
MAWRQAQHIKPPACGRNQGDKMMNLAASIGLILAIPAVTALAQADQIVNGCRIRPGTLCADMSLKGFKLAGANFANAQFSRSDLTGARLAQTILDSADLTRANLRGAILTKASLKGADLQSANLSQADLSGAIGKNADMQNLVAKAADFRNADFRGVDFRSRRWPSQHSTMPSCSAQISGRRILKTPHSKALIFEA